MTVSTKTSALAGSVIKAILITGLVAGTLDATAAIVIYKVNPISLFKFIASGAFGKVAFSEGAFMVFFGVIAHYFIAYSWTSLYFLIFPKIKALPGNKYSNGVLYGTIIWMVMNLIVVPLSKIPSGAFYWDKAIVSILILIFMVGLPITILAHRYYGVR